MKRFLFLVIGVMCFAHSALCQESEKFRVDVRVGYTNGNTGDGILLHVEPKWSINKQMNIGFRVVSAGLFKKVGMGSFEQDQVTGVGSILGTYDYYYAHKSGSPFAAFVGGGVGYYGVSSVLDNVGSSSIDDSNADLDSNLGAMIRVGFDYFKFRVAFEVNFAGNANVRTTDNIILNDISANYVGLSLGFYFGGGKWKNVQH